MSQLQDAEQRFSESAARHAAAAGELRRLRAELAEVESQWYDATYESMTPEDFAVLMARRELLRRAVESAAAVELAAAVAEKAAGDDLGRLSRSLFDARLRRARAIEHGNGPELRRTEAQIKTMIDL